MKSEPFTFETMMTKAQTACGTSRMALECGDADGAASRAYYAMFYAARAALLASRVPIDPNTVRTHSGLLRIFGEFLVKNGSLSKDMGITLNKAFKTRLIADYKGSFIESNEAQEIVAQAEAFVAAIRTQFMPELDEEDDGSPSP